MTRYVIVLSAMLCPPACTDEVAHSVGQQPFMQQQGRELQGLLVQGTQVQGKVFNGFRFAGATLNGAPLAKLRIEKGELVAEQNQVTLRDVGLVNAHLLAEWQAGAGRPPQTTVVEYRIAGIVAEPAIYDPTHTGSTFLYTLEQNVDNTGSWQPACPVDGDGRSAAIPLTDTWDARGHRVQSAPLFTLACTTGVIAKCYRWGYRPWITGFGNLTLVHSTCTRAARADYCGDGGTHTMNGTLINIWDNLPSPGPILAQGATPPGMTFEAAWDPNGALCLSHARWNLNGAELAAACPNRLRPPGQSQPGTVCDSVADALMRGNAPLLFDESAMNQ